MIVTTASLLRLATIKSIGGPHRDTLATGRSDLTATNALAVVQKICEWFGYRVCDDGKHEPGHEKLALYVTAAGVQHAARQLQSGRWTSKIGELEDIEHTDPQVLEGDEYGSVAMYMKRKRDDWL